MNCSCREKVPCQPRPEMIGSEVWFVVQVVTSPVTVPFSWFPGTQELYLLTMNKWFMHLIFFKSLFIYFWERARERAQVGEGQRHRERERIPSRLCTDRAEPDVGLKLLIKSRKLNRLSHPGAPAFNAYNDSEGCFRHKEVEAEMDEAVCPKSYGHW